jgi:hypothetical protein
MAQDNPVLRTEILKVVNTYGCFPEYKEMVDFFTNPQNNQGIVDAQELYNLPRKNTESYHTGLGIFGSWHDFCDREPMGKFYQFAKLSIQYPSYSTTDQANCQKIKDSLVSLKAAKSNISEKNEDIKKSIVGAFDDKIAQYTTLYANLTCDKYIANQAQIKASTQSVNNALNVVSGGNTYIKYAIGGGVILLGYFLIKRVVQGPKQ